MTHARRPIRVLAGTAALVAVLAAGAATAQSFEIMPEGPVPHGQPVAVVLTGVAPGQAVDISAARRFGDDAVWRSRARFTADARGRIELTTRSPVDGDYDGVDAAGLFWSMVPTGDDLPADWRSGEVRLTATVAGQVVATGLTRLVGAVGAIDVEDIPGFPAARLYRAPGDGQRPVIVVLHGADGGTRASDRYGRKLAALGYAVVGLPYYSPDWGDYGPPKEIPGLPGSFIDIRVDQIAELRDWLAGRSDVDAGRIALFGGSKGAEFALVAASKYPWITSVVAFAPSDLVWEGWGLETIQAEGTRSSFSFRGEALPFMPYVGFVDGLLAGPGNADLLKIHEDGRAAHPDREAAARIRIEDFPGEVMLVAGDADREWRSGQMARNLTASRSAAGRETVLLVYPDAGHDVGGDGWAPTAGEVTRGGGTAAANARAQADAWPQVLAFLQRTLGPGER
ncbi:acyl-CoA thioester hydrolase/BAAT C-terminal domain-containing protein [uncultured Brevundimonas sp.]|uniref:acyl-CoA thioesterase/BAAT N-terminal domain-containing protein n=1 Tax=uncultured Brevundimonas sp. TaxID=213418 RepID=UPI0030EB3B9A|tara:strand:- start:390 stop:1751 length:1362 start_codon:yes stop_codon:yes gene_type:complete